MSSKIDKNVSSGRSMRYPKLLACRGCLATRCKLYNIENCKLMDVYSVVVGLGITATDGLPQHMCVNCVTMCRKFIAFRNKCRKAQDLLLCDKQNRLTTRDVENIDRKDLGQLYQTKVICFDCVEENDSNIQPQSDNEEDKNNVGVGALIEIEAFVEPDIKNIDNKGDVLLIERTSYQSDDNNDDDINDVSVNFDSDGQTDKSDSDSDWDKTEVPIEVEIAEDKKRKKDSTKGGKRSKNGKARKQRKKETKPRKIKLAETLNRQPKGFNAEAFSKEFSLKHNVDIIQLSREQQLAALDARQSSRNYVTSPLKCELCYKGFLTEDALAAHQSIHETSRGEYICDICRYRFKKAMHLSMHQRKHRVRYVCKDCGTISTCNQNAIRHHQWHKGQRHPCKYCDVVFEKRNSLVSHVHKKHGIEMDMCELCGAPYSGNLGLIRHRMNSHGGQIPVTRVEDKCPVCSIQFLSADALKNHQRMNCAQEKIWSCVTCGENVSSKLSLRDHLTSTHSKYDPNREYKCDECGNTFASTIALGKHIQAIHLLRKTGDEEWKNKYVCEACGKRFPFPSVLRKHQIRVHNGEKGQSSQPRVRVRLEEDPSRPLRTISGDKLYKCPHCPKVFQSTTNRQVHVRTHTGERPYVCPECGRAFSSGASLQRHARVHTGEKPYSCPQCGKSFTQSNSMKLHVTTVHLKLPAPYKSKRRPPDVK